MSLVGEPGEKSRQESARRARRKERGSRPESDVLLLVKPSTGRHGSEAPSTKDGELGLVEAETLPERSGDRHEKDAKVCANRGGRVRETWVVRDTTISPRDARSMMEKRSGATGVASTDT